MFCESCGKEIENDTNFCKYCGKDVGFETHGNDANTTSFSVKTDSTIVTISGDYASKAKKFSPGIFALIIILFFLPFVAVTCSGQHVTTLSGIQVVTGTTVSDPSAFGQTASAQKVGGEPMAIVAFILPFIGLGLSFLKSRKSSIAPAIIGGLGAASILLIKARIDDEVFKQGQGMLQTEYQIGFWLIFWGYILATALNIYFFSQRERSQS